MTSPSAVCRTSSAPACCIFDGSAEGGSRGGYWTNARKAFAFGAIGRVAPGPHRIEAFYLDRDELPESETGSRVAGVNYQFTREGNTLGVTYFRTFADAAVLPNRDGMHVFNVRANAAAVPKCPDLSFAFEYASERHGDLISSNAWTAQGAYLLSSVTWTPKLSYRYAFFQGDDPATPRNEAFDPLFTGFADWGSWWQGEIAGEYFLSNSNLISHMIRVNVSPTDSIDAGVIFYDFRLDQLAFLRAKVTDKHAANELDGYVDWNVNNNFVVSFVLAFASPGKAVEQATGRTQNFKYGMVYVAVQLLGVSFPARPDRVDVSYTLQQRRRRSGWIVPLTYMALAVVVGLGFPRLEHRFLPDLVSTMSTAAAMTIGSAIASGMMALTAIVFSVVFLMIQFSATAYSPRLVLWIARDPVLSHAMGVFSATFLYALTMTAWVDRSDSGKVPLLSVWLIFVLLVVSMGAFVALIERVSRLQVNRMLIFTGDQGRDAIDDLYSPADAPAPPALGAGQALHRRHPDADACWAAAGHSSDSRREAGRGRRGGRRASSNCSPPWETPWSSGRRSSA